jgi:hypothetical protein
VVGGMIVLFVVLTVCALILYAIERYEARS